MAIFRFFLIAVFLTISIYTAVTISLHGWNLIPEFFGRLTVLDWQGQFNTDFATFLLLSGLWLAWRHEFSLGGIALGLFGGVFGGMLFLSAYLLFQSFKAKNDIPRLLLGDARADRLLK
jgi:hypothetical protein